MSLKRLGRDNHIEMKIGREDKRERERERERERQRQRE